MRNVLRSAENKQQNANDGAVHHQDITENRGDFKYGAPIGTLLYNKIIDFKLSIYAKLLVL